MLVKILDKWVNVNHIENIAGDDISDYLIKIEIVKIGKGDI